MTTGNSRMKIWKLAGGVTFVAILVGGLLLAKSFRLESSGVEVAEHVPAYSATNLAGELVSLSDYEGKVVLVNVWATWCGPCRVEMPSIQASYDRFKDQGFVVLAVSIDTGPNYREKVLAFVEEHELSFPVLLDPESRIMRTLRTVGVPETFVLDREGRIVKRLIGATNWDSNANRALIEQLLRM